MALARSVILLTITLIACGPGTLAGTDLGTQPAPDFTLTDGLTGSTLRLSSLRGSVVALSFLYTRCPDVCPLTAEYFRQAQSALGDDSAKVHLVAVSVDPDHDIPSSIRSFSEQHRLDRNWHFLIGPAASLRSVWAAYGVQSVPDPSGLGVGHTDAIYLIDVKGNARVLLHTVDGPETLTKDLRILTKEK
jgi:protein SCO1/2